MKHNRLQNLLIPSGLFLLGFAVRLLWGWHAHLPTMDTAIVGLMAMDIQEGARPLFFTGQGYMGALEAYLTAGIFEIFGAGRFTMTLAPSFFGAAWAVLVYFFLKQDVPTKAAIAGSLLVAFPSYYILWYTTVPYGGYPEMYVFGTILLLHAATRWKEKTYYPLKDALFLSTFTFLGAWTNLQVAPFIGTAGLVWIILLLPDWRKPKRWLPFSLVVVAFVLALLPQILISKQNPSSPPLFDSVSFEKISFSLRGLFRHNLKELVWWKGEHIFPPVVYGIPFSLFILSGSIGLLKRNRTVSLRGLTLCGVFVFIFSILYFPHPMAGFIPRYVIAPFVLVSSVFLSLAIASGSRAVSILAHVSFGFWLVLQLISYPVSLHYYRQQTLAKTALIQDIIELSRNEDLTHLRMIGSQMEGHRMSTFTFLAEKNPVFVSSYDERRRNAELAWHANPKAGYFFSENYEPFVKGSLDAMGLSDHPIKSTSHYRVMSMPVLPLEKLAGMKGIRTKESLNNPDHKIRITFPSAKAICGLRLTAPENASLPYHYEISGGTGAERFILSKTQKKLGTSYISGDRIYFKGFQNQMDVIWETRMIEWLEFSYTPGPLNAGPIHFENLFLFSEGAPASQQIHTALLNQWLNSYPNAKVVASDGVAGMLRRNGVSSHRLPLPWNPRTLDGQPPEFSLQPGQTYLILTESRFAPDTEESVSFGPIKGRYIEATNEKWNRFVLE